MNNFILAWRNLWRNKRRTLITAASVFFAVIFALAMRSLQLGSYDHMFRNVIESYTGYIQVQNEEFKDNPVVDNAFELTPELRKAILESENVDDIIPRFESFALASSGPLTKGVLVMGIDTEKESLLSNVKNRLVKFKLGKEEIEKLIQTDLPEKIKQNLLQYSGEGYSSEALLKFDLGISDKEAPRYMPIITRTIAFNNSFLESGKMDVLLGDRLSRYLNLGIGDTLVLLSQGWHGTTAAGKFRVAGIVRMPTPDIDNKIIYMPVDVCREFYNAPGMVTSVVLSLKKTREKDIDKTISVLGKIITPPLKTLGWKEMNEILVNQMDADNKSGAIMVGILYLVIAFGIFGTVLMMTTERRREFGVLVAIGMQKKKLAAIVSLEMLYVGFLGILSGIAVAIPVILYGLKHPIRMSGQFAKVYEDYGMEPVMAFMPVGNYFLWQSFIVALIVGLAILYPIRKISKMKLVNSLKP